MSSDEHESDHDTSNTEDGSEDSLCDGGGLIDLEAEESGLGSSEDSESDEESSVASGDSTTDFTFPQFMQLPPELRYRIWHFYCPDLSAKARVLQFTFAPSSAIMKRPHDYSVKESFTMADQTETLRAMLSTHRESRSIAVLKYPDELSIDAGSGDAIIRYRKETDVISVDNFRTGKRYFLPGFATKVQNFGLNPRRPPNERLNAALVGLAMGEIKGIFPNLKRVFLQSRASLQWEETLQWCVMDYAHVYMVATHEKSPGLGEDLMSLFCWPDVNKNPDLAHPAVPRRCPPELDAKWGVEMWPMVEFENEEVEIFDKLRKSMLIPDLGNDSHDEESGDSDNDTEDGTDSNEYESEGIDDSEIIELEGSSEDELLVGELGRFSSPESESDGVPAVYQVDDAEPLQRSRKRKTIVVDSDDEEEAEGNGGADNEDEPRRKRARHSHLVLDSDDDEEEEEELQRHQSEVEVVSTRRAPNSARVMLISSDDDDDDDEENKQTVTAISDSDSQEEDEDAVPAKLSLAERLQRAKKENSVLSVSEGDSENTDEDSRDEEDEDEDEDEEDEDNDEDGLLDTIAGEETEDEEDDGEDAW
ncbi:hypothetical protein E4U21_006618 [Claviceps maximensis]|nr:hypothetical protein E4U21_006618 [Claviceps maximensis]